MLNKWQTFLWRWVLITRIQMCTKNYRTNSAGSLAADILRNLTPSGRLPPIQAQLLGSQHLSTPTGAKDQTMV